METYRNGCADFRLNSVYYNFSLTVVRFRALARGSSRSWWNSPGACFVLGRTSMKKEIEKCATNEDFTGTSRRRPVIFCYVYLFMLSRRRCVFSCFVLPPPPSSHRRRSCTISRNFAPPAPSSSCSRYASSSSSGGRGGVCTTTGKT